MSRPCPGAGGAKGDLCFFPGVARLLFERGWIDEKFLHEHTGGAEDFRRHVAAFTIERLTQESGISAETLDEFARLIHEGERVSFWWTMGVNRSYEGVRTAQSLINLALMTGNIGRPGTGANSITGQCNAIGSRPFSHTAGLPGAPRFHESGPPDRSGRNLANARGPNSRAK